VHHLDAVRSRPIPQPPRLPLGELVVPRPSVPDVAALHGQHERRVVPENPRLAISQQRVDLPRRLVRAHVPDPEGDRRALLGDAVVPPAPRRRRREGVAEVGHGVGRRHFQVTDLGNGRNARIHVPWIDGVYIIAVGPFREVLGPPPGRGAAVDCYYLDTARTPPLTFDTTCR